ncbi:hypothetical protein NQ315_011077 [Exocentrus adspersus]|uniref:RRM domain-containing protein n=1 Tax=Exocentrus adspersus TaxID=1586481 RepID=A0AAV8VWR4_9CUCU|nr:hypothetical protein NQ315_011077 [Exocentrus adspersus]
MELQTCLEKKQFATTNNKYPYDFSDESSNNMEMDMSDIYQQWALDRERRTSGNFPPTPELSDSSHEYIKNKTESQTTMDLQKLINELQIVTSDDVNFFTTEDHLHPFHDHVSFIQETTADPDDIFNVSTDSKFDITKYLVEDESKVKTAPEPISLSQRKLRAGVKKNRLNDTQNRSDDGCDTGEESDDINVDVVSNDEDEKMCNTNNVIEESTSLIHDTPYLQAGDLFGLLEQFEATELPCLPDFMTNHVSDNETNVKIEKTEIKDNNIDIISQSNNNCKDGYISKAVVNTENMKNEIQIKTEPEETFDWTSFIKTEFKSESDAFKIQKEETVIAQSVHKQETVHAIKTEKLQFLEPATQSTELTTKSVVSIENDSLPYLTPVSARECGVDNTKNVSQSLSDATTLLIQEPAQTQKRKVLNELSQDLIYRMKESRKRKAVSIIPPVPNKKYCSTKIQETTPSGTVQKSVNVNPHQQVNVDTVKPMSTVVNSVELDHDYCAKSCQQPIKCEKDDRAIMMKQPMVKNADGKLMVSLLKVNTINGNNNTQKRKLDIEEYKKRREGKIKFQSSQSSSTSSSASSSPAPEDERIRVLKHQEKLRRMALEVLKTRPKSEIKQEQIPSVTPPSRQLQIPCDMEKKTLVSIGVNTEFKICKTLNPVTPVEQLEEIKPLLEKAGDKFSCNSLITSVIENIPKVINNSIEVNINNKSSNAEHGEDKTIIYLPKNRVPVKTRSVEVQTDISLHRQTKNRIYRRRRRDSSSSSSSSRVSRSPHYNRKRKSSNCSCGSSVSSRSSRSSTCASRSSSQSRSRSRTPPKYVEWENERIREIEERRVVYVGRISENTTKEHLRQRFERFGPVTNISLHFRKHGDNYGFVTFVNQYDAFEAIEHANDDPLYPKYDLSFGGRRQFCKTSYSDLDNVQDDMTYYPAPVVVDNSFDTLLREAQEKLRRRKF